MKSKLKELTSRSNGWGNDRRKESLRQYIIGWVNYFKLADMQKLLLRIDEWYRRRIRMVIWKQWKRIITKQKNLVELGVKKSKAWEWANTRKGYWHIANSHILKSHNHPQTDLNRLDMCFIAGLLSKRLESKLKDAALCRTVRRVV